ncbi:MAG: hypothetical protein IJ785_08960 [Bacteroidales bacterium]|nr:hypothetical protein [Bacteroidales bacterium]
MLTRKDFYNIPGWRTRRHLIVIESDDWGSIRMPSAEVYNRFLAHGVRVDRDPYCQYDNLATADDLSNLFEVLNSVKDCKGNPAVITANTVTANPDFEKIAASDFETYHYEPFTATLAKSPRHAGAFALWQQGMDSKLFHPQLHGREHLNVKKWLAALRAAEPATLLAFQLGTFGLTQDSAPTIKQYYLGAFNSSLPADIEAYGDIIRQGADLFGSLFGYRSESFIAPTYEWNPAIEPHLIAAGVKYLQGTVCQKIPIDDDQGTILKRRCFQGTRSPHGMPYLMRNCFFEPSLKPDADNVGECLRHIKIAFRWGKAANICSHRVNYIGSIDKRNTDRNLPALRQLLSQILRLWPDSEFITSDRLGHIIQSQP